MNRRGFLKRLLVGSAVAGVATKTVLDTKADGSVQGFGSPKSMRERAADQAADNVLLNGNIEFPDEAKKRLPTPNEDFDPLPTMQIARLDKAERMWRRNRSGTPMGGLVYSEGGYIEGIRVK